MAGFDLSPLSASKSILKQEPDLEAVKKLVERIEISDPASREEAAAARASRRTRTSSPTPDPVGPNEVNITLPPGYMFRNSDGTSTSSLSIVDAEAKDVKAFSFIGDGSGYKVATPEPGKFRVGFFVDDKKGEIIEQGYLELTKGGDGKIRPTAVNWVKQEVEDPTSATLEQITGTENIHELPIRPAITPRRRR